MRNRLVTRRSLKMIRALLAMGLLATMLAGCATGFRPAPEGVDDTLVVLRYEFDTSNMGDADELLGTSAWTRRVKMRATHIGSGTAYTLVTYGTKPMITAYGLAAGSYEIPRIEIELTSGNMTQISLHKPLVFDIRSGFVNNLGRLSFVFTIERTVMINPVPEFTEVQHEFAEDYPDSEWNQYTWLKSGIDWKQ